MTQHTCPHCSAVLHDAAATICRSCGGVIHGAPSTNEARAAAFAEVARVAKAEAWTAHVPANRFVERQHSALRSAIAFCAVAAIVLVPTAAFAVFGAVRQVELESPFLAAMLVALALVALGLAGAAAWVALRVWKSFRAYGRAPVEQCPALVVTKRRVPLGKGGKQSDYVTLEFANGERREYRADKAAFELATEQRAGLAYLRANHLLDLKLLPD